MISRLTEKFDSLLKVFEILYVIENVKPVARIMVHENEYNGAKGFLKKCSLHADKSNFKVLKLDKNTFSNKGEKIKLKDKRKGHYFIYISKNKNLIKKAKEYEEKNDHISLGLTLGYPRCCCEFFNNNSKTEESRFNDYTLPALNASEGFIFPFENNFAARHFDLSLLSHFPCNFSCKNSREIAKKHLKIIEQHSDEYAAVVRGMLKGAVIYTENYGVFLLRDSTIKNKEIAYNTVMGTKKNRLSELLRTNNRIKVIGKNHIRVGKQRISTKNMGIMFFI